MLTNDELQPFCEQSCLAVADTDELKLRSASQGLGRCLLEVMSFPEQSSLGLLLRCLSTRKKF